MEQPLPIALDLARAEPGEPGWVATLRTALAEAPDPESAARLAEQVLAAAPAERLEQVAAERPESLARVLGALCGTAPFLSTFLRRRPEWLFSLALDDLSRSRSYPELDAHLGVALAEREDEDPAVVLRRFKYYELARLSVRDACPEWVPLAESGETLEELSCLADVLLDHALRIAQHELELARGEPCWRDRRGEVHRLGFCVLGLGKLGSEELNYSSDVDLVYIYESPNEPLDEDGDSLSPVDYFTRLARRFASLVSEQSSEGFLYRIDLDLRPEGSQGSLVVPETALEAYYESWAEPWEKAAFMKARPVAGDLELGWRAIRAIDPMIYKSAIDYSGIEAIQSLKDKVEQARGGRAAFDVKIDRGGIRDVEFVAQSMQLMHGGRIPQLRDRSTQRALRKLAEVNLIPPARVEELLEAYRFLRRTENRLQMEAERQVHRLPGEPEGLRRLARAMGFLDGDSAAAFTDSMQLHRGRIESFFASYLSESGVGRIIELFARHGRHVATNESTRRMLEALAEHFAREIDASPDPERALNNLDRFIEAVGRRAFYYELLLDRPDLVPRLTALFAASKYLSSILSSHPRLIEPVFEDPDRFLLSKAELRADLAGLVEASMRDGEDRSEHELDALRLFHHRQVVNVGLLDIAEKLDRREIEGGLSETAEVCIEEALAFTRRALEERKRVPDIARQGAFLVVGMGKLATREMSYGSDLDLIFLFDLPSSADAADLAEAQAFYALQAQRLISSLQTPTSAGSCYEVDARLRPSGHQGALVSSLASFRRYHDEQAHAWERQLLLRARPVAGEAALGSRFESLRREILDRPAPEDPAAEIHRLRSRMETELAREVGGHRDFKTGRGGVLDVESVVQLHQLRHGGQHSALFDVVRTEIHLAALERFDLLDSERVAVLREGWEFLQRLGSRMRIVENRSISDLDEDRGDLESLARRLGYGGSGREGGARRRLLQDYRRHTEAIRRVYLDVFGDGEPEA